VTTSIPDSWELPAYLAGELVPMSEYEDHRRDRMTNWDEASQAPVVRLNDKTRRELQKLRAQRPPAEPPYDWADAARRLGEIEPYDPEAHGTYGPTDMVSADSRAHLEQHGFEPTEDTGVWTRRLTHANGDPLAMYHTIMYAPGHRLESNERAPWLLMANPDEVGTPFRSASDAVSAANADRDRVRKMSRLGALVHWESIND